MKNPTEDRWGAADALPFEAEEQELTQGLWRSLSRGRDAGESEGESDFTNSVFAQIESGEDPYPARKFPPLLRSAATILPTFLLPKGLIASQVGSKSLGTAVLSATIAPALVFIMLAFAAFAFLKPFVRREPKADHQERLQVESDIRDWWGDHWRMLLPVMLLFIGLSKLGWPIVAAGTVGISALALFAFLNQLSREGYTTRNEVGQMASHFLGICAFFAFQMVSFLQTEQRSTSIIHLHIWILILGSLVALYLTAPKRSIAFAHFFLLGIVAVGSSSISFLSSVKNTDLDSAMARYANRTKTSSFTKPTYWRLHAEAISHWKALGNPTPNLTGLKANMRWAFEEGVKSDDINPLSWIPVTDLDLIDEGQRKVLMEEDRTQGLINPGSTKFSPKFDDLQIRLRHQVEPFSEAESLALVERMIANMPEPSDHDALEEYVTAARTWIKLGQQGAIPRLKEMAHQALSSASVRSGDGTYLSFSRYPNIPSIKRKDYYSGLSDIQFSSFAVWAMHFWGIPDSLDLRAFHRYLQREGLHSRRRGFNDYTPVARASLLHLETLPTFANRTKISSTQAAWRFVNKHFLDLGAALLVLIALWTTIRAPRQSTLGSPAPSEIS